MGHNHGIHPVKEAPMSAAQIQSEQQRQRYRQTIKVTLIGSVVDLLLGVAKIVVGVIAHSQSLIADGIHSLSDLLTDMFVIYAAKHSSKAADEDHPYGHGRIETVATVGLGIALVAVAVGISWDAISRLFEPERLWVPGAAALVVATISIISKEAIYHYSMTVARKYRSAMLKANAWHSRTDAITSVIVVVGVAGAMAGLDYLDAIAAIGVAGMIAKIGWDLVWNSVRELVDTGLEPERVEAIRESILAVDGVKALHVLRTRRMGGDALVDVHIQVPPEVSVSEGHHISETVREQVIKEIDEVADVMVHIDPEDDEIVEPNIGLPLRQELCEKLKQGWSHIPEARAIRDEDITLHYLEGKVRVDVALPLSVLQEDIQAHRDRLQVQFRNVAREIPEIGEIGVYFR